MLSKDTHGTVIRFAPPLVVEEADLMWAVDQLVEHEQRPLAGDELGAALRSHPRGQVQRFDRSWWPAVISLRTTVPIRVEGSTEPSAPRM